MSYILGLEFTAIYMKSCTVVCYNHRGTTCKKTQNHRYGDNRKMAAGFAYLDTHRHRIDKYLDTLPANQPISDNKATDRCQRRALQDGGLPELTVARSCLTNRSEAASL